jgi:hypothetical protein
MAVEFEPLHDRLTVVPAGTVGGRPMSDPVVQRVWLPIIGPASIVVAAELARGLAACPGGFVVGTADLAARCGLSENMSKHAAATADNRPSDPVPVRGVGRPWSAVGGRV